MMVVMNTPKRMKNSCVWGVLGTDAAPFLGLEVDVGDTLPLLTLDAVEVALIGWEVVVTVPKTG